MRKLYFSTLSIVTIGIFSCSVPAEKVAELALKAKEANIFTFKNNKADTFNLSTGSSIVVPANSVVDATGKLVSGEVKISFEEFHSKGEIMLSKLPMTYKDSIFESAGMFSIQANCEGKPVFVDSKKPITVSIASDKKEDDFNLYSLNDSAWKFVEKAVIKEEPIECTGDEIKYLTFKIRSQDDRDLKLIDFDIDYSNMPELKEFKDVMWTYAGESDEQNPHINKWVMKEEWEDAIITRSSEKGLYNVELTKKGKKFTTLLSPVFTAKDKEKAELEFESSLTKLQEFKEYESNNEKRAFSTREDLNKKVQRIANIIGFGTYNFDKCKKGELMQAAFEFQLNNKTVNASKAYLIVQNTMVPFSGEKGIVVLRVPLNEKFKVAVAINDSTMGFVKAEDFTKVMSQKSSRSNNLKLEVKKYAETINNREALEKFMTEI